MSIISIAAVRKLYMPNSSIYCPETRNVGTKEVGLRMVPSKRKNKIYSWS